MIARKILAIAMGLSLSACATVRGDLASIAESHKGKTARQLGLPPTLWCADAANLFRRQAGLRTVPSRRAADQAKHAKRLAGPAPGALMITRRGRHGHHVDVVIEVLPSGLLRVIGGNIDNQVAERLVPPAGRFYLPL